MGPSTSSLLALFVLLASFTLPHAVVPNFSDLKIKTRRSGQLSSFTETLYLKGARQRQEYVYDELFNLSPASISRCDDRKRIDLNVDAKLYAEVPIADWSQQRKGARPVPPGEMTGAEVTITTDSVDTGERRKLGTYLARHVRITIKVEAGPGATEPSSREERDGWYLDLPGLGCQDSNRQIAFLHASWRPAGQPQDRIHFKRLGTAPSGFAIEETTKKTENASSITSTVELVEFSEASLTNVLFDTCGLFSGTAHAARRV